MGDVIFGTIFLGIIFILWLASWCRKQGLRSRLFDHVSWCIVEDEYNEYVNSRHLLYQIYNIYSDSTENAAIEKKYRLCHSDEEFALEILDAYRANLVERYFKGSLNVSRANLSRDEYYMLSLCGFLEKHECCTTFNENTMYELLERTNYGTWGTRLYTATYELTSFGVVFNKLLYAARTYCENSKPMNKKEKLFQNAENIRERLESNRITISVI